MDRPDDDLSIDVLCDAIVARYHASLQQSIASIRDELAACAAGGASSTLEMIRLEFAELADEIHSHLAKEENLLFPSFHELAAATVTGRSRPALPFVTVLHPIRLMEAEHARIESTLDRLRQLAREVAEPECLSDDFRRCMADLARLDTELRDHHRTENEVLFPRALELERRLV